MQKIFLVFLIVFLPFHTQAQDNSPKVLEALNLQVDYLNAMDSLLYPTYVKLVDLNSEMLKYTAGNDSVNLVYINEFTPKDNYYKIAITQKYFLPLKDRAKLVDKLDSLHLTTQMIEAKSKELAEYLGAKAYQEDNMQKGYKMLQRLGTLSRFFLVKHEDLHSLLLNTWYDYYFKKSGKKMNPLIVYSNRALAMLHVVYLDLGYDSAFKDANSHLLAFNELLVKVKSLNKENPIIINSPNFQKFTTLIDSEIFQHYGEKRTISFYKKFNGEFVKSINTEIIPAFNNIISENHLLCIKGKMEPPFFETLMPDSLKK